MLSKFTVFINMIDFMKNKTNNKQHCKIDKKVRSWVVMNVFIFINKLFIYIKTQSFTYLTERHPKTKANSGFLPGLSVSGQAGEAC